jgi:DNA topoisomerase-1
MSSLMTEIKDNKSHIKIDDHHVYMIGKYGPVIKYEKDGTTEFKNVKKDLDLDKLKNGEYKLENIIVEKPKFGGKNLGSFKSNEVILRKGKFGLYMTCGGKNYSLKGIDKSLEGIRLEDVIDILLGTKSTNPKVLKMLNEDMSVRKGKYGPYLFYKKKTMTKPRFFGIYEVFGGNKGDTFDWKSKSSSELINLVKKNCLKSV